MNWERDASRQGAPSLFKGCELPNYLNTRVRAKFKLSELFYSTKTTAQRPNT
jgi:hypothetical protein